MRRRLQWYGHLRRGEQEATSAQHDNTRGKAEKTKAKIYGHHRGDTRANGMEEKDGQDRGKRRRAIQQTGYLFTRWPAKGLCKVKKIPKITWRELTPPTHPNFFFWKPITHIDSTLES